MLKKNLPDGLEAAREQGLSALPLPTFRKLLLSCQDCFAGLEGQCKHHEDVLGGYQKGKIVVVGVNLRTASTEEKDPRQNTFAKVDAEIEASDIKTKTRLSEHLLKVFENTTPKPSSNRTSISDINSAWTWSHGEHWKLACWLPLVQKLLSISRTKMLAHFAFVEVYKHTVADLGELTSLGNRGSGWSTPVPRGPSNSCDGSLLRW